MYLDYETIPNLVRRPRREYDFIIVGAGTAGATLAYELAKNRHNLTVLLLEAGGKFSPTSKVPLASTILQGSKYDWEFKTVPQKYSSQGLFNQVSKLPTVF